MAKTEIVLRGKAYTVACAPGRERRLQGLARVLERRLDEIVGELGDIGAERTLLLAALSLLDELEALQAGGAEAEGAAASAAAARIDAVSAVLERAVP